MLKCSSSANMDSSLGEAFCRMGRLDISCEKHKGGIEVVASAVVMKSRGERVHRRGRQAIVQKR